MRPACAARAGLTAPAAAVVATAVDSAIDAVGVKVVRAGGRCTFDTVTTKCIGVNDTASFEDESDDESDDVVVITPDRVASSDAVPSSDGVTDNENDAVTE